MADTATSSDDRTLEAKLEEMLDIETFEPPEEFAKHALLSDPSPPVAPRAGVAVDAAVDPGLTADFRRHNDGIGFNGRRFLFRVRSSGQRARFVVV